MTIKKGQLSLQAFHLFKFIFFQKITNLPTNLEPQIIMCVGILNSHIQCQHVNSFVITTQCAKARTNGRDCTKSRCKLTEAKITQPPLCPNCFRAEEIKICEKAEKERNRISEDLDYDKWVLARLDLTARERWYLEWRIEEATNLMNMNCTELALKLKNFRESQGVWGDA